MWSGAGPLLGSTTKILLVRYTSGDAMPSRKERGERGGGEREREGVRVSESVRVSERERERERETD